MNARDLIPQNRQNVGSGFFNKAGQAYDRAASSVQMPSQQSLDRGAARLRSRLSGRERELNEGARTRYAGSGGNIGGYNRNLQQNRQNVSQAYASGLTDLEQQQFNQGIAATNALGQIGAGYGNLGAASQRLADEYGLGMGSLGTKLDENDINRWTSEWQKDLGNSETNRKSAQDKMKALGDLIDAFIVGGNTQWEGGKRDQFENLLKTLFGDTGANFNWDAVPYTDDTVDNSEEA